MTHNFVRFSSQNSPDRLVRHHSQIDKIESHITYEIVISSLEGAFTMKAIGFIIICRGTLRASGGKAS